MNKQHKAFLKTLLKSIEQAKKTQESIAAAVALGVTNKAACTGYVQELQQYINDAQRMVMQCTVVYGKGSDTIAVEAVMDGNKN